jgi:hypothetical protein
LETHSEELIEPPDHDLGTKVIPVLSWGRVPKYAVIDVKNTSKDPNKCIILGIQDDGRMGTLHEVTILDYDDK